MSSPWVRRRSPAEVANDAGAAGDALGALLRHSPPLSSSTGPMLGALRCDEPRARRIVRLALSSRALPAGLGVEDFGLGLAAYEAVAFVLEQAPASLVGALGPDWKAAELLERAMEEVERDDAEPDAALKDGYPFSFQVRSSGRGEEGAVRS
jgi:hypothetical protein